MPARLSFAANLIPRNNVELHDHANQFSATWQKRKDRALHGIASRKKDSVAINFQYDFANLSPLSRQYFAFSRKKVEFFKTIKSF